MNHAGVLLAALLTAAACTPPTAAAERVAVPALRCTLDVPAGTAVAHTDDGATFTTRPGTRAPRRFSIHARPPGQGELHKLLAADVSITYTLHANDGGSGGAESVLAGALQVRDRNFAVTCHDQAEPPADADATWCLPWLATLRVDPSAR